MLKYIIVCSFLFLSGFVDSIAGGGGLISFPGFLLAGVPMHYVIGTSKLSGFPGSVVATIRFAKNGYVRWKLAICWAVFSLIGGFVGAKISLTLSENIVKNMMFIVLPIVAFFVLKNKKEHEAQNQSNIMLFGVGSVLSLIIGMYNGFYGPGTGTFLILAYSGIIRLSTKESAGIAKFVNFIADISAMVTYSFGGKVDYKLGIIACLFCMVGSYFGSGLVISNGQKIVRPLIIIVLALLFVKMIVGF